MPLIVRHASKRSSGSWGPDDYDETADLPLWSTKSGYGTQQRCRQSANTSAIEGRRRAVATPGRLRLTHDVQA
jgi:hypothetical protein